MEVRNRRACHRIETICTMSASQCAKSELLHQVAAPISASFNGMFDAVALEVAQVYARSLMQLGDSLLRTLLF